MGHGSPQPPRSSDAARTLTEAYMREVVLACLLVTVTCVVVHDQRESQAQMQQQMQTYYPVYDPLPLVRPNPEFA
jgi:hypothetical protein